MPIEGIRRLLRLRFTRRHLEHEVDEEIADHVARRAEQLRAAGLSPHDALAEARRRFGDVAILRDECLQEDTAHLRNDSLMSVLDTIVGDLRFAGRSLRRAPGFTAVSLATLVLGIGSVTALFSFFYSYGYRPLPYKDADRTVAVVVERGHGSTIPLEAARMILATNHSFERISVFENRFTSASVAGRPASDLVTLRIDSSFIPMFGIRPAHGRAITSEEVTAAAPVAMISDALWQTMFGADETLVGRTIPIGEERVTIVGIMPPTFRFPNRTDLWRPLHVVDSTTDVSVLGRIRDGVDRRAVDADLAVLSARLPRTDSPRFAPLMLSTAEIVDRGLRQALPITSIFIFAALFVLVITCSNVANLLLVRAAERRGEMAVRASLGASRGRLLAQALTESLVLATLAGVGGTVLSTALVKIILAVLPVAALPSWLTFEVDGGILLFTTGVVLLVTLGVGLTPAREGTRFDLARALKIGGDAGAGNSGVAKAARRGIVIQLSLSVVLFVGAALLYQTYRRLSVVDIGYPASEIVSLKPLIDLQRYPTDSAQTRLGLDILDRVRDLAGVRSAAVRGGVNPVALSGGPAMSSNGRRGGVADVRLFGDGDTTRSRAAGQSVYPYPRHFAVSDDYFRALGLRIIRGRSFANDDVTGSQTVVVLSRRFAGILWPRENPIGRVMQFGATGRRITVIGVVEDVRDIQGGSDGLSSVPRADAYYSSRQVMVRYPEVLARAAGDVTTLQAAAQAVARRVDPQTPMSVATLSRSAELETMAIRLIGWLIGGFAISGLVLSIIGIYGVVAYGIAQRTREIGIRLALGGTSRDVLVLVLREALKFTTAGLLAGLVVSLGTGRVMRVVLFGVSATDPLTYSVVCVVFASVAMLACYLPARRVLSVDPIGALRAD